MKICSKTILTTMSNAFKSEAIKHFKINKNIMELQPKFTSDDPNFQPVYNQVQPLSMFKCTIVYCSLSILTISTIFWLIMFVWNMFHHYRLLYGNWYYTFYVFYCLLIIFKIISSLIESQLMINCHHLCRLLIMVRIVSFVEYLIFTRLIFSIVEVENVSGTCHLNQNINSKHIFLCRIQNTGEMYTIVDSIHLGVISRPSSSSMYVDNCMGHW